MTLTRIVRPGRIAGCVTLIVALGIASTGCRKPMPTRPAAATTSATGMTIEPGAPSVSAEAFARDFLKAVNEGTAPATLLTPTFKKLIAPPVFDADKAVGYSDHSAESWLKRFQNQTSAATLGAGYGSGDAIGFVIATPSTVTLRVVRTAGTWGVDWFLVTPTGVDAPLPAASGEASLTTFAGAAMLHALLAKNDNLVAAKLSPTLKAAMAPPLGSDQARGYNLGFLHSKLGDLRGNATGFRVTKASGDTVSAELVSGGTARAVTLKFVKGDRPWDRLVSEYDVK